MIQEGGNMLYSVIHKFTNFIWNKEELPQHVEGNYYCTYL